MKISNVQKQGVDIYDATIDNLQVYGIHSKSRYWQVVQSWLASGGEVMLTELTLDNVVAIETARIKIASERAQYRYISKKPEIYAAQKKEVEQWVETGRPTDIATSHTWAEQEVKANATIMVNVSIVEVLDMWEDKITEWTAVGQKIQFTDRSGVLALKVAETNEQAEIAGDAAVVALDNI
jgi:hypothetical protein